MRSMFPGYYRPKSDEFAEKFKECTFCFDTNVLLNLYRFTPESRDSLIQVLRHAKIKDRIWLPHRVGFEYQRRRTDVLLAQKGLVVKVEAVIDAAIKELEKLRRTSMFAVNALIDPVRGDLEAVKAKLQSKKEAKSDLMESDLIFDALTELFEGKIGKAHIPDEEKALYKKGKDRFAAEVPPGYKDASKDPNDTDQYGDLILWFQIIEYAKSQDKPIILVTDDAKEDWWREAGGETLGPRVELIEEFTRETGGKWFYMYSTEAFLKHAKEHLEAPVTPEVLKEAGDIKNHDAQEEKERSTSFDYREALDALNRSDPLAMAAASEAIKRTTRLRSTDYNGIAAGLDKAARVHDLGGAAAVLDKLDRDTAMFDKFGGAMAAANVLKHMRDISRDTATFDKFSGAAAALDKLGDATAIFDKFGGAMAAANVLKHMRDISRDTATFDKFGGAATALDTLSNAAAMFDKFGGAAAALGRLGRLPGVAEEAEESESQQSQADESPPPEEK